MSDLSRLPQFVLDELKHTTADRLIDWNEYPEDSVAFACGPNGKLIQKRGVYHADLLQGDPSRPQPYEELGLYSDNWWDFAQIGVGGRCGLQSFWEGGSGHETEVTPPARPQQYDLPLIVFYAYRPQNKHLVAQCVRSLAHHVGPNALVLDGDGGIEPIDKYLRGAASTKPTWNSELKGRGLIPPGGSYWRMTSEAKQRRLERTLRHLGD